MSPLREKFCTAIGSGIDLQKFPGLFDFFMDEIFNTVRAVEFVATNSTARSLWRTH
jgi:hypothetical protein